MKSFKDIREARGDTCVFTFGRFNPPTTGHEKLLDAVAKQAKKNAGAPYYVFASHSEKSTLPYLLSSLQCKTHPQVILLVRH